MADAAPLPTPLQRRLAAQIVQLIDEDGLVPGRPLTVVALAGRLKVSRTPVRGALGWLVEQGVVTAQKRGFVVRELRPLADNDAMSSPEEALTLRIAADYIDNALPDTVSESDLMRRYDCPRGLLLRVLQRMARDLIVERNQGHGWTFAPLLRTGRPHDESYRFRLAIEPAAILEPGFALDPAWAVRSREAHAALLATPPDALSMIRFYEVNADFHEGIAAASGNAYFHQAVRAQGRLRRFLAYGWTYDTARVGESCAEHMAILDQLAAGDAEAGAALMRAHLAEAGELIGQ